MPAQRPRVRHSHVVPGLLALMALLLAGATARLGAAKAAPKPSKDAAAADISTDDLQRSRRLDTYTILADSGAARGENIYFYKCWMCHNQYTKSAPLLKDLFQRENLTSGDPVNDDNVTAKIKEGGPGMPAFRTSLSDTDIADLRTYFHSGKCCVEGENPPANPWYQAETHKWSVQSGLTGGATGMVRIASGDSPEGVGVQLVAPNGVRTTVYTDAANLNSRKCKPDHTSCAFRPQSHSSPTGGIRSRSTGPRSSTTSCWKELRPRTICLPHRSWNLSSAARSSCGTCPEAAKKKLCCRRIAPDAIPGSRFSGIVTTSIVGA